MNHNNICAFIHHQNEHFQGRKCHKLKKNREKVEILETKRRKFQG